MKRWLGSGTGTWIVLTFLIAATARGQGQEIDDLGQELTLSSTPTRIVSLAPSNTEILFAIGAGDRRATRRQAKRAHVHRVQGQLPTQPDAGRRRLHQPARRVQPAPHDAENVQEGVAQWTG